MGVELKWNGRRVNPNQLGRLMGEAIEDHVEKEIANRLRSVTCPTHGGRPRVTVSHRGTNPQFKVEGCCQDLIDRATAKLK